MAKAKPPAPAEDLERTLPASLDAERAVLGAILLHNDAYNRACRYVGPGSFFRDAHSRVFQALQRLLERSGGAADLTLLREELARTGDLEAVGGPSYIASLIDGVPRSTNVEHYAQVVAEKKLLRDCVALGNQLVTDAYVGEDEAAAIISRADQAIITLQHGAHGHRMHSLAETQSALLDTLQWRVEHKDQLTGIPTGFTGIDQMTLGWQPGDLVVLAARPSIGKTTLAMNSAFHAAESLRPDGLVRRVAAFSMEMRRGQLENRLLASLTNCDLSRLLAGYIRDPEWPAINAALARMRESGLHIDDTASRTVGDIRAECRRLRSEAGLDLVLIDYIQLMPGSLERRGATRNEEITHISRSLKIMADDLAVPVLVLSQLRRTNDGRSDPRPRLDDLRESGALEQDADIVLFLHRKNHRESGTTQAIFEKQRNGPTGVINLTLTRETCLFTDGGADPPAPNAEEKAQADTARKKSWARRAHSS